MLHGTYVGTSPQLKGKTALLRECHDPERTWFAQFDQMGLMYGTTNLSLGWHWFAGKEFKLDRGPDFNGDLQFRRTS